MSGTVLGAEDRTESKADRVAELTQLTKPQSVFVWREKEIRTGRGKVQKDQLWRQRNQPKA